MKEVDKDTFEKEVLKAKKIILVDVWGPNCHNCLALMSAVEELAKKYSKKLKVVKMNVVGNRVFLMGLKVMGLPTIIFYKKGREVKRLTGIITKEILEKAVEELI
ncbi:MAG: thioredoxin fold domain-containing protein [Candidatus Nealsonbacteria bacterium]|nr:thioredoxin fold domain-containing protein [Candidatus Nealsonbacteria bacterium]